MRRFRSMTKKIEATGEAKLIRALGPVDATMMVVGSMIGSGIFIVSAESTRLVPAPGWLLVAWTMAGLMTIMGALCCAELATMMPHAGGVYVFLREAYGPAIGFLFGWTLFLVVQTGTIAAVAIAFARFLGVFVSSIAPERYLIRPFSLGQHYALSLSSEQLTAIVLILFLSWTNTRGLRVGKIVQNTFTSVKTLALIGVVLIGLFFGWKGLGAAQTASWWNPWLNGWNPAVVQSGFGITGAFALFLLLGKAMVGPVFAQTAWTNVTFIGSEVRDPARNLVRALLWGCAIVVVLYVLANLAYISVLPLDAIAHAPQNRVAVAMLNTIFGYPGAMAMAAAIMISTFGCDNGLILAGSRVYFAMARDGLFFRRIASTNRHHVPAAALLAQGIWTAFLTLPRTVSIAPATGKPAYGNVYTQLLEYIVSADLLFYILLVAAVLVLRRTRPEVKRPYRTWGYPLVPIVAIALAVLLIADLAWLAPSTSGIGMLIVLSGAPVYLFWRKSARFTPLARDD